MKLMNLKVQKEGPAGKARLALAADKSVGQIDRYRKGQSNIPTYDIAHSLALACGCSEKDADALARACIPIAKVG